MNRELITKVQEKNIAEIGKRPEIKVGDTVVVHTIIRDSGKTRIQKFEGMIIAIKGSGIDKMFTVRKISYGIGVEKIFPLYSTNIDKIEVKKHANVRRAKLYYMRDRIGKAAMKLKPGAAVIPVEAEAEVMEEVAEVEEAVAEATEIESANTEAEATEAKAE